MKKVIAVLVICLSLVCVGAVLSVKSDSIKNTLAEQELDPSLARFKIKDTVFVVPRKYLYFPNVKKFERDSTGIDLWWPSMKNLGAPKEPGDMRVSFYMIYKETDLPIHARVQRMKKEERLRKAKDAFGLEGYHLLNSVSKEPLRDLFIKMFNGKPSGYVRCNLIGQVNNPQCKYFVEKDYEGIVYAISLDRNLLDQWPKIEKDVFEFVENFKEK